MLPRTFFFCGGFGLRKKGKGKKRGMEREKERKGDKINIYYCYVKRKERR